MDETAIWADMPGNSTIEVRGAHTVQIATTGHDKQRITICLAAFADGTKLKPFVVFKGKRIPKEISNVHAAVINNLIFVIYQCKTQRIFNLWIIVHGFS